MENGTLEYNMEEDVFNGTRPNGTVATYTCINGFRLDGNATRTCDTGNWTGTVPVCIESRLCTRIICMYNIWYNSK